MTAKVLRAGDTTFYEFDQEIGFWGRKNFSNTICYPERPSEKIHVSHNSLGNRDDEFIRDDTRQTVAFFGGSHTWGYGVTQGHRFSDIIKHKFRANVQNFGHCSLGLDQIALVLFTKFQNLNPNVVVIEQYPWALHRVMAHQVNGFIRPKFYIDQFGKLQKTAIPKPAKFGAYRAIYKSYVTYRKQYLEYLEGISVEQNYDAKVDPIYLKWKAGFYKPMYDLAEAIIQVISGYCRENGIELLFVLGTVREKLLFESGTRLVDYDLPRKNLVKILQKYGVNFLDTADEMLKIQRQGNRLIFEDGHINEAGHLAFSEMISGKLKQLGVK